MLSERMGIIIKSSILDMQVRPPSGTVDKYLDVHY